MEALEYYISELEDLLDNKKEHAAADYLRSLEETGRNIITAYDAEQNPQED